MAVTAATLLGFYVHWVAGVSVFVVGCAVAVQLSQKRRLAELTARFGADAAAHIMSKHIWQGATPEMIVESIGRPVDIDGRS